MNRREIIAGLGSAAGWPIVARAQQVAMPVIGFLMPQSADDDYKYFTVPFLQGLQETGYVVGQNAAVEYRYVENQVDRLPALAADQIDFPPSDIPSQRSGPQHSRFPAGPGETER